MSEEKVDLDQIEENSLDTEAYLQKEIEDENNHAINYRNCSWQRTAGLLFSEYICLAIMSFPWSYSVLGLGLGLIVTVIVSLLSYPHLTDVCDIGRHLIGPKWVWYATAVAFLLNNTLIQALHVLVGAKYFNTISDNHTICSIVFGVVSAIICFLISLPRTFSHMSSVGYFSAITMFIAVVLAMAFVGVQSHPYGFKEGTPVHWRAWPAKGEKYVNIMSAVLNIVYTFVGQITYPSFISQMKQPKDFKKALIVVTICELITFSLAGSIIYVYVGNAYVTAPAFGSLVGNYKKIALVLHCQQLYFLVPCTVIHTVAGWAVWIGLNGILWAIAFVIAEVIPFFSDLLSLMSSLFDCFFGFIFWALASIFQKVEYGLNVIIFGLGVYILGPGLYATIQSIIWSYQASLYGKPFSCVSNAI
ncbi:Transmembrane amino acid transporter family protein [Candida albicans]|uniref:Transmembrane amino acid transporter family protein n=1 Tax=Candida albicans TaxID=5476 RepID=A0A8H6C2X2_CANAX|nr:Transmembrane amino acid transporter family protein [Candida albicans]